MQRYVEDYGPRRSCHCLTAQLLFAAAGFVPASSPLKLRGARGVMATEITPISQGKEGVGGCKTISQSTIIIACNLGNRNAEV
jgi:hypothetical protein